MPKVMLVVILNAAILTGVTLVLSELRAVSLSVSGMSQNIGRLVDKLDVER